VLALEGGYDLEAIAASAAACLRVLLGEDPEPPGGDSPAPDATRVLELVLAAQRPYWGSLQP